MSPTSSIEVGRSRPRTTDSRPPRPLNGRGGLESVVRGLDRPTSMELVGDTAYVVTLTGKVIAIDGVRP